MTTFNILQLFPLHSLLRLHELLYFDFALVHRSVRVRLVRLSSFVMIMCTMVAPTVFQ